MPVPGRILWALTAAFVAGVALHIAVWLPVAPWAVAIAIGATLLVSGAAVLRIGLSEPSERALHAGLAGLYLGASLLVNSWWPVLALLPTIGGLARWQAMEDDIRQPSD